MPDINSITTLPRFPVIKWRFNDKITKMGGCWLWHGSTTRKAKYDLNTIAYGKFQVATRWGALAHRVSYVIHIGPIPDGMCVMHKCDNPLCVNPKHLKLGTNDENVADKMTKGRHKPLIGERHWKARLNEADIAAIRASTDTGKSLADKYGVRPTHISKIRLGKSWAHVP